MSGRRPYDDPRRRPARDPRAAAQDVDRLAPRDRQGPVGLHIGRVRVTPLRATLAVALVGGLLFLAYSVLVRDALQVPLMTSGFAIVGIVFGVASILAVRAVVRAGRERRDAAAVLTALLGGLAAVGALLSLAVAVILGLIWSGTKSS